MTCINIKNVSRDFSVLKRREGLIGSFLDLFSRNYSSISAVNDISFSIDYGELVGFIGQNGAGKSTTIKMLAGILGPTRGSITVDGFDPHKQRMQYVKNIGVVFGQRTQLWWDLPVIESFKVLKEIYDIDTKTYQNNLGLFNDLIELRKFYNIPVRNLSLGQRIICDIVASFLHNPKIIFLDEPTIGLDVDIRSKVRSIIKELNNIKKTTVLLTSHDVGDIEFLAHRIILIEKGSILYDGSIERFNGMFGQYRTLFLNVQELNNNEIQDITQIISYKLKGISHYTSNVSQGWLSINFNQDEIPLVKILNPVITKYRIKDIKVSEVKMEEVIRQIYKGSLK